MMRRFGSMGGFGIGARMTLMWTFGIRIILGLVALIGVVIWLVLDLRPGHHGCRCR